MHLRRRRSSVYVYLCACVLVLHMFLLLILLPSSPLPIQHLIGLSIPLSVCLSVCVSLCLSPWLLRDHPQTGAVYLGRYMSLLRLVGDRRVMRDPSIWRMTAGPLQRQSAPRIQRMERGVALLEPSAATSAVKARRKPQLHTALYK